MTSTVKIFSLVLILCTAILAAGLVGSGVLKNTAASLESRINTLDQAASQGNWALAEQTMYELQEGWDSAGNKWAILIDHAEIDLIESAMVRTRKGIQSQDASLTLSENATLKQYIQHIPEKEKVSIENIF